MIAHRLSDANKNLLADDVFDERMIKGLIAEYIQEYSLDDIKNMVKKLAQF